LPLSDPHVLLGPSSLQSVGANAPSQLINATKLTLYDNAAIFVRLPSYGFRATCMLFSYITSSQFPSSFCPKPADKQRYHVRPLGTIGFFNFVHPMVEALIEALHNNKIFLAPRAWDQGDFKFPDTLVRGEDGKVHKVKDPWGTWADLQECDVHTYAYNPWACHFISLSSCNNPELHNAPWAGENFHLPDAPPGGVTSSIYLRLLRDKIKPARSRFGDAPLLNGTWTWSSKNEWEFTRCIQFVLRPNVQLRARLRRALRSVALLRTSAPLTGNSIARSHTYIHPRPHPLQRSGGEACVAMHVRHGDSAADDRAQSKVDRSLSAHIKCAGSLLHDLGGVRTIFLATDDPKIKAEATTLFPHLGWFMQSRELRDTNTLYDFHWEKSKQQDVASVVADVVLASRCAGFVGSFDSGFADLMHQEQCGRSESGVCPPMKDLLRCQNT